MPDRPELFVLAGVNGAGKSSVGGYHLQQHGLTTDDWFNPDAATRALVAAGEPQESANSLAWTLGRDLLLHAIATRCSHAFETTLGGTTIPGLIAQAAQTHAVRMWFCGLDSPEHHLKRVRERVARGGHHIPEARIRARWISAIENLIGLMPLLSELQVYDNSRDAGADGVIPDPELVLHVRDGEVLYPDSTDALARTPEWAMAVVEAALSADSVTR